MLYRYNRYNIILLLVYLVYVNKMEPTHDAANLRSDSNIRVRKNVYQRTLWPTHFDRDTG